MDFETFCHAGERLPRMDPGVGIQRAHAMGPYKTHGFGRDSYRQHARMMINFCEVWFQETRSRFHSIARALTCSSILR